MGYRETFFAANPGVTIPGKRGKQWQCVNCGGWFPKSQIDVDHRLSKRYGGTDDLYNLQPMCQHCNRSKNKNSSGIEVAQTVVGAAINGDLKGLGKSVATQGLKDLFGIKYKR